MLCHTTHWNVQELRPCCELWLKNWSGLKISILQFFFRGEAKSLDSFHNVAAKWLLQSQDVTQYQVGKGMRRRSEGQRCSAAHHKATASRGDSHRSPLLSLSFRSHPPCYHLCWTGMSSFATAESNSWKMTWQKGELFFIRISTVVLVTLCCTNDCWHNWWTD